MRVLILFCGLFFCANAGAQRFAAAAIVGANFSQIDGDDLNGFYKPGINAGIRAVVKLGENWRVGPEFLYSQQGARRNTNSFNFSDFDRFQINAVEVPLMAFYRDWRIMAEAGLSYNRIVSFTVEDRGGQDISTTSPLADEVIAMKFGATYFMTENLGVNLRWNKHLTNVNDFGVRNMRGRTVSLRLVYTFGEGEVLPVSRDE